MTLPRTAGSQEKATQDEAYSSPLETSFIPGMDLLHTYPLFPLQCIPGKPMKLLTSQGDRSASLLWPPQYGVCLEPPQCPAVSPSLAWDNPLLTLRGCSLPLKHRWHWPSVSRQGLWGQSSTLCFSSRWLMSSPTPSKSAGAPGRVGPESS